MDDMSRYPSYPVPLRGERYDENGNLYTPDYEHGAYPRAGTLGTYSPPDFRTGGPGPVYRSKAAPKEKASWPFISGTAAAVLGATFLLAFGLGSAALIEMLFGR